MKPATVVLLRSIYFVDLRTPRSPASVYLADTSRNAEVGLYTDSKDKKQRLASCEVLNGEATVGLKVLIRYGFWRGLSGIDNEAFCRA